MTTWTDSILDLAFGLIVLGWIFGDGIIDFVRRLARAIRGE